MVGSVVPVGNKKIWAMHENQDAFFYFIYMSAFFDHRKACASIESASTAMLRAILLQEH